MDFFNKYFGTNISPQFLKQDYEHLVEGLNQPGIHKLDNQPGNAEENNTVTASLVAVTQNSKQEKTSYLVESFFTYNHFMGRVKNISFEQDGNFTVVSERYFATITDNELVGPVRSYSGFTINENEELTEISPDKSQMEFERCSAVIDNAYSYQPMEPNILVK